MFVCVMCYSILNFKKSRHYIDYFERCQLNSADVNVDDVSNFEDVFRQVKKSMNAGVFWNDWLFCRYVDPHIHRLDYCCLLDCPSKIGYGWTFLGSKWGSDSYCGNLTDKWLPKKL